jgi:hypothetical protein
MPHLPSDPNARPFDISSNLDPSHHQSHSMHASTPLLMLTSDQLPPPPCLPLDFDSPDVLQLLSAKADAHLQVCEKRKLSRGNIADPDTGSQILGDAVIGDILHNNKTLIPFVIDLFGCLGPILHTAPLAFPNSRPNASKIYKFITTSLLPPSYVVLGFLVMLLLFANYPVSLPEPFPLFDDTCKSMRYELQ